jgi:3-oxoacyl-[acyl-carrier protein] reductase
VDVLVNNAAFGQPDSFLPQEQRNAEDRSPGGFAIEIITPALHDKHFAVNSRAVALLIAEYAKRHITHKKQWGRIISVSTDAAMCFPGLISYGASKYALESYNRSASKELGRYGITVNIVSAGPIQTGWISPELEEESKKTSPLGRIGQPEDVADVIVFLASEQARWLTGQLLYVGGGHAM